MLPWVECPSLTLNLDLLPEERIAEVSDELIERSRVVSGGPGGDFWWEAMDGGCRSFANWLSLSRRDEGECSTRRS